MARPSRCRGLGHQRDGCTVNRMLNLGQRRWREHSIVVDEMTTPYTGRCEPRRSTPGNGAGWTLLKCDYSRITFSHPACTGVQHLAESNGRTSCEGRWAH
eukprot:scaffold712_cov404-Prasinococcus_capsulatus_cf.AAC.18